MSLPASLSGSKIPLRISRVTDPYWNLATEEWLMKSGVGLFIYRNVDSVVVGRNQNQWIECNMRNLRYRSENKEDQGKTLLVRRRSGGGTVFHDLGNINFSLFFSPKEFSKVTLINILSSALKKLNLNVSLNDRHDILSETNHKISGSAFRLTSTVSYHHCSLLVNANLQNLRSCLQTENKGITSLGVKSVKSPIRNLIEDNSSLNFDTVVDALAQELTKRNSKGVEADYLSENFIKNEPFIENQCNDLKSWKWMFGQTPTFSQVREHNFDWGRVKLDLQVESGIITKAILESHFPQLSTIISQLEGMEYEKLALEKGVYSLSSPELHLQSQFNDLRKWISTSL